MADGHLFNSISLGGRGGTNAGQLRIHSGGILWKKSGGGKAVEVDKADVVGLTWMKVPRSNQLGVRIKDGLYYKFTGFRDQDVATVTSFLQSSCGITPEEKQLSVSGKNWGEVDLNGNMLTFLVGSKQAFEVSLADVSQTQLQGKNDVILEFHVDDTTGANEKDSLMEISFHIPNSNTQFVGDENRPSAQVFRDKIMSMADVGAGGEESVVTFEGIAILTPRGRYNVELHLSFLRLQGQANDFKIQYSSVVRLFLLPKSNQPHTFVVVTLDPPICKGQTLYPHIVLQFETDYVVESTLSMNEHLLNSKYEDKLEPSYKGLIHEVFILIMRGLSGAKVTRPGKFRSCQDGYAVKSSLKTEDGVLYPLEKGFFFLHKPPTLILHKENAWNEAFHSGRHTEAVEHYTAMVSNNIKSRPFAAICFCNRTAAHQSLGQIADAIADCSLAIVLDGSYSKAVSRRATFHETIRDYEQAASDLHRLISLLEKQSQEKVQQCGSPDGSAGGDVKELRQARRRLSSVEEKAKKGISLDHYLILGIKPSDAASEIKKAYRKAALRHHPDKAGQSLARSESGDDGQLWKEIADEVHKDADRLFKMIGEAYAVLSDLTKRSHYDLQEELRNAQKESNGSRASRGPSDYYSSPFDGSASRRYWKQSWKTYGNSRSQF